MASKAKDVVELLQGLGDAERAEHSQRYFKTGKGEYGEGDRFLGIRVPVVRKQVKLHKTLSLAETERLLKSPFHEARLCAALILVEQFRKADAKRQGEIYKLYLRNTAYTNNWDIIDSSAPRIVGGYLLSRSRRPLFGLAKSKSLWERRIAIMATLAFINEDDFADTLKLAQRLLHDKEDLIHKAVGWMLREVGNKDRPVEESFLATHYQDMPRTMLRYAIEKFPERRRQQYLKGRV
jgi:3-methyladenine DNA glycosylase AlkD